jgi:putative Mg2+ transporter-C (MgtC) family protein
MQFAPFAPRALHPLRSYYGTVRPFPVHRFQPRGWSRLCLFPSHRRQGSHVTPCVQSLLPVTYAAVDTLDIALRLGTATLVGAVLGLNRDLHGKPTGVRTLGLVCLGSALAVLSIQDGSSTDASRIVQGIMTGVGFLGAGVIVRNSKGHHVHGLTTAACVWVTACIGAACAVAEWQIVVLGAFLVLVILVFGGPFEKAIDRRWPGRGTTDSETRSTTRAPSSEM